MKTREEIGMVRAHIGDIVYGFHYKKDYFELSTAELKNLETFRQACNFSGKNNLGRSKCRQFWYYLQTYSKNLPF